MQSKIASFVKILHVTAGDKLFKVNNGDFITSSVWSWIARKQR